MDKTIKLRKNETLLDVFVNGLREPINSPDIKIKKDKVVLRKIGSDCIITLKTETNY